MTNPPATGGVLNPPAYDYVGGNATFDALLAEETRLYAQAKEIEERLKAVKDQIKGELTRITLREGQPYAAYNIRVPGQPARALKWTTSRRLDTPMLRAAHPEIYDAFTKESGAWKLERVK